MTGRPEVKVIETTSHGVSRTWISRRMVLNTVQLNQAFVGYLAKLTKNFMIFMDSMHRIGCNTILLLLLPSTVSCDTL